MRFIPQPLSLVIALSLVAGAHLPVSANVLEGWDSDSASTIPSEVGDRSLQAQFPQFPPLNNDDDDDREDFRDDVDDCLDEDDSDDRQDCLDDLRNDRDDDDRSRPEFPGRGDDSRPDFPSFPPGNQRSMW